MLIKFETVIDWLLVQNTKIDHQLELKSRARAEFVNYLEQLAFNNDAMRINATKEGQKYSFCIHVLTPNEFDKLKIEIRNDVRRELKDKIKEII